jgi:hypothetical protein
MIERGRSPEEVLQRFEDLRGRPELLGGDQDLAVFLDSLQVDQACRQADRHYQAKELTAGLAEARKAAQIVEGYFRQEPARKSLRLRLIRFAENASKRLRDGNAAEEALTLLEQVNVWLQGLAREAPEEHAYYSRLATSWEQIAKVRWVLHEIEGTLDAYRAAQEAQRRACTLAPTVTHYRLDLGGLHLRMGRKLCELGRLDEAELCFRERQALWPGDAEKHQEALRELRKWAAQVKEEYDALTPEQRQYYPRYLDLYKRLERKGIGMIQGAGVKP